MHKSPLFRQFCRHQGLLYLAVESLSCSCPFGDWPKDLCERVPILARTCSIRDFNSLRISDRANQRNLSLVNHVDGFLGDGIEGGDRLRVGFKGALGDDQVREFGGDVDVRGFQRTAFDRAAAARASHAYRGNA